MADELHTLALSHAGDAAATVQALGTLAAIWAHELPRDPVWLARVTHWLAQINANGMLAALTQLNSRNPS